MKSLSFIVLFFYVYALPNAITYTLNGGRLGDNLITYSKARWLSYKYGLPLLYVPFEYSDQLQLHTDEQVIDAETLKSYKRVDLKYEDQLILNTTEKLYVVSFYTSLDDWYDWESDRAFPKHLDVNYVELMREAIKLKDPLPLLELPKDMPTLAVHVRKGGGFDKALLSEQETVMMPVTINHYVDLDFPLKFPPDHYYIEQIKYTSEYLHDQPLYVHIFTDDSNPERLVKKYEQAVNKPNIVFGFRQQENSHATHVLEDLFAMQQFDYLIRSTSSFAKIAHLIGDFKIAIYPEHAKWLKHTLYIDKVCRAHKAIGKKNTITSELDIQKADVVDVVITCCAKQQSTLDLVIAGIQTHIKNIGRIIVVSDKPLTKKAEWFDVKKYPFTCNQIHTLLNPEERFKWIADDAYYQLLRLYAPLVIPDISSHVLVVDGGTLFCKSVDLIHKNGGVLYTVAPVEQNAHIAHGQALIPGFKRIYSGYSAARNFIVLQKPVLEELFECIRAFHDAEPWQVFCECVDRKKLAKGTSAHELYFNFFMGKGYSGRNQCLNYQEIRFSIAGICKAEQQGCSYIGILS